MPTTRAPRHGSLQFRPHAKAKRVFARVRSWNTKAKDVKPLGFAGYKAGMTHLAVLDTRKNSPTRGIEVSHAVTVIECPPLKIHGIRLYRKDAYGLHVIKDYTAKADKNLAKRVGTTDKPFPETISCDVATLLVHTQPSLTGMGQKTPEVFEVPLSGKPEDVLAFAKAHKELKVSDVFKSGQLVDVHSITKGQGFSGVVKKAGVGIRRHKSEKVKRGAVMAPEGYAKVTFEANMPGKFGNHTRSEWNKKLMLVGQTAERDVTPAGGFLHYGVVKNDYILLKGSVPGYKNGLIRFTAPIRKMPKMSEEAPAIEYVSTVSQQ
jgi:large subunit ribosomal protein L3